MVNTCQGGRQILWGNPTTNVALLVCDIVITNSFAIDVVLPFFFLLLLASDVANTARMLSICSIPPLKSAGRKVGSPWA
jgi:hypothetical protein